MSDLLFNLDGLQICSGSNSLNGADTVRHVVPMLVNPFKENVAFPFPCKEYIRSNNCRVLIASDLPACICKDCSELLLQQDCAKRKSRAKLSVPAHPKAPIKGTSVEHVGLALQENGLQNKQLMKEIEKMKAELEKKQQIFG